MYRRKTRIMCLGSGKQLGVAELQGLKSGLWDVVGGIARDGDVKED